MESVLASLGALLIRALPTFLILLVLHAYLKLVFFKPLEKALAERRAATSGTKEAAEESMRNADRKMAEYEEKLRHARGELFHSQEQQRKLWRDEQTVAVSDTRSRLEAQVRQARERIAAAQAEARTALASETDALAEQIARTLLAGRLN